MLFKDRKEAGEKLANILKTDLQIKKNIQDVIVVSLLRGGIIIGNAIAKILNVKNIPLVVTKIPAPYNLELAIGAVCYDQVYLNQNIIASLSLDKETINNQIIIAKEKFSSYLKRFRANLFMNNDLINKLVILTDDGIATSSTVSAGLKYLKSQKTKLNYLASPVAPSDFINPGFDKLFILFYDQDFYSVSQYYKNFPQIEDEEVKRLITNNY